MVRVRSRVYTSHKIALNNGAIEFHNGVAEISEELWNEIVERKFPNIYKEGEEPEYKTPLETQLRKEVSEGNKEFEEEIKRLKNIIEAQKIELAEKDKEIVSWKKAVENLQKGNIEPPKDTVEEVVKEKSVDEELFKELSSLTVKELIEMGTTEVGGGFSEKDFNNKKKDEIIEMIMSKS